jgi:RNA polymerase sigma-70 factor (ECF subfamily)
MVCKMVDPKWEELARRGKAAWPDLDLDSAAFIEHLRERVPEETLAEHVQAEDLFLACACSHGDEAALRAFEEAHGGVLEAVVRRFRGLGVVDDDIQQLLRIKLFVGQGRPKIAQYSGVGPLSNWLRVTAVRLVLDKRRESRGRQEHEAEMPSFSRFVAEADPELTFLKSNYQQAFREAFAEAVAALTSRDRNLLRQQVVWARSIDQIGAIYHLHRSTVARQLARARQTLLETTRASLASRLEITAEEVNSIIRMIQSRLDLSLVRIFKEQDK